MGRVSEAQAALANINWFTVRALSPIIQIYVHFGLCCEVFGWYSYELVGVRRLYNLGAGVVAGVVAGGNSCGVGYVDTSSINFLKTLHIDNFKELNNY